ncbi:MAG TPA: gamma-glutamylcyclotransferase family protein [Actinomycetes bacterium]
MERLFVYGTLRPGQPNHARLLDGAVAWQRPAVLPNHQLLVAGLPFVAEVDDGGQVLGELLGLVPGCHESVLRTLDRFEGYRPADPAGSLYVRVERAVTYRGDDGRTVATTAWVYQAGALARRGLGEANRVPSGDWLEPRPDEMVTY